MKFSSLEKSLRLQRRRYSRKSPLRARLRELNILYLYISEITIEFKIFLLRTEKKEKNVMRYTSYGLGCYNSRLRSVILNISKKKVTGYPPIKKNANGARPPNLHNATRKFKKMRGKDRKSKILIARLPFSMMILWRRLHRDFLRFVN